ncbi:MAG: ABC transporter ATP-binding protein [Ectothiorhodospiraceae bacterium]|nr:ABC transporter ATP-binding protein [Ectothiorhodospiraceae bacterium]
MSARLETATAAPATGAGEAASQALLSVHGLSIALPPGSDRPFAVEQSTYTIERGSITCIVGESGSGKSMTANAIMGLLPQPYVRVAEGTIHFDGKNLVGLPEQQLRSIRGAEISMIFQEPMSALNPLMTVGQQVAEVLRKRERLPEREERARIARLLESMDLPDPERIQDSYPFRLSGGQRQRVMIAMALALSPRLLIADEPTTALDVTTQKQILSLIREQQRERGMGVMFITHDFGVVAEIADKVVVMEKGRIVEQGAVAEILNHPRHPYTRKLISAVPTLNDHASTTPESDVLLEVRSADKVFRSGGGWFRKAREVHALNQVSLTLRRGEILGLVGESGSGKSTLARSIIGLNPIDSGEIHFLGEQLLGGGRRGHKQRKRLARHIQIVFQDPYASLNPRRKVGAAITLGPLQHGVPVAEANARAKEMLSFVGLDASAFDRYPHEFSGGQRQRIGIARALAMRPEVLIADEAVSALDVSVQKQVLGLLEEIRQRMGVAILFVTHDLRVAATICHRLLVMRHGQIVEEGETSTLFAAPREDYTRALLDAVPGIDWQKPELEENL